MKHLLFILVPIVAFGQVKPLPFINPGTGGGGGGKNFNVVQNVKNNNGASVSITPTAGNALVVFAESTSSSTISISDGVNSYTVLTNQYNAATQGFLAWAKNVSGSTVTVAISGGVGPALNVYEVSGVTSVDSVAQIVSASSPASLSMTTSSSDLMLISWCSESVDYAGTPSATLSPGSLSGSLSVHDSSYYGAWWYWGPTAGIAANTYTASIGVPSGNAIVIGVAFQ